MSDILYAFLVAPTFRDFSKLIKTYCNPFMVTDKALDIEIEQLYNKLKFQTIELDNGELEDLILSNSNMVVYSELFSDIPEYEEIFLALRKGKQKRNVGDAFKWIVTDNWSVDLMITFNLRSFMHFQKLRNSGSAYFQIRELSNALLDVTPEYIKKLISKK
jgi:thymidylate synthase (FAD)